MRDEPARRTGRRRPRPTGIAANSRPSARPPPGGSPNVRSAISGNRIRGMPNAIAMMSARNETSSTLCSAAYRNPATTSRRPARARCSPAGGIDGQPPRRPQRGQQRDGVEQVERRQPDHRDQHARRAAARRPRRTWKTVKLSVLAAGSSAGVDQPRDHRAAGGLVDRQQRRLHREQHERRARRCRRRSPRSPTARATSPRCPRRVTSSSVRRSTASAIAPPHSPNTTSGTSPNSPVRPT